MVDDPDTALNDLTALWARLDELPDSQRHLLVQLADTIASGLLMYGEAGGQAAPAGDVMAMAGQGDLPGAALFGFLVTDRDGVIRQASPQAAALLGSEGTILPGRHVLDYVEESARARVSKALETVLAAGQSVDIEADFSRTDGGRIPLLVVLVPFVSDGGSQTDVRWLMVDVSERREVEARLSDTQQRLVAMFEQAAVGIAFLSLEGAWERVNHRLSAMLGYEPGELLALSYDEIVHPDDLATDRGALRQLLSGESDTYGLEMRYRRADGSWMWANQTTSLLRDEADGAPSRIIVVEDMSSRRQIEDELRVALERAQDSVVVGRLIAAAQTPEATLEALLSSRLLAGVQHAAAFQFDQPWDDARPESMQVLAEWRRGEGATLAGRAYALSDFAADAVYQRDGFVYVADAAGDERFRDEGLALWREMQADSACLFPLRSGGKWFGLLALAFAGQSGLGDEETDYLQGLVDQAAGSMYTLTLFSAEAAARQEAERANDLKMRLLATISHELRTPLTSIKGFASTLLAEDVEWDSATQHDFVNTINEEADKLTELIGQLLDLTSLEAGKLRFNPQVMALDEIVDAALSQLSVLTAQHELVVGVDDGLIVEADPRRIAQVLANLVGNAAKYSAPGTTIALRAAADGDVARVTVTDQGMGISAEDRQRVFQAFEQGRDSQAKDTGAGLGLAISHGIVEKHGGEIWIEDAPHGGTEVIFTLPLYRTGRTA